MPNQHQNSKHSQQRFDADDEIELMDLLLVLWKWKRMIILITFFSMVIAALAGFMMPKIYEVSMAVEPGVIGLKEDGAPMYMDILNIKGKIENGIYNAQIVKKMGIDPFKTQLKFKVVNPKDTKFIKITSEWKSAEIGNGKKILKQLADLITYDGEKIIQRRKEDFDKQISLKMSDIQENNNQIKYKEAILKNIRERKADLVQEIKQVNKMQKIKRLT